MWNIGISFVSAFLITYWAIPSVVNVARIRQLFDVPDERKVHKATIPSLGGVAIFAAVFFSIIFWSQPQNFTQLRWIILSLVIIFLLGLKDDIVALDPYKKLAGQLAAALLLTLWGDIRISSLHNLMGIGELPYLLSISLSMLAIIVIVNAFNLIDGIDGLAGSIGTISSATFGLLFMEAGQLHLSLIAFSLMGALLAFLRYNITPAKIFMGDGGSLIVGLIIAILSIKFWDTSLQVGQLVASSPVIALTVLIIPLTDTSRVFFIRMRHGRSPFQPDRNHLHHQLLHLGMSHIQATLLLSAVNGGFILLGFLLVAVNVHVALAIVVALAGGLAQMPTWIRFRREARAVAQQPVATLANPPDLITHTPASFAKNKARKLA